MSIFISSVCLCVCVRKRLVPVSVTSRDQTCSSVYRDPFPILIYRDGNKLIALAHMPGTHTDTCVSDTSEHQLIDEMQR